MHEYEGFRHLPSEENLIKAENLLGMRFGVSEKGLKGEQTQTDGKRSRKVKTESR